MPSADFVRHAETEQARAGQRDEARLLTSNGREQARLLGSRLSRSYDLVVASPTARAVETAELMTSSRPVIQAAELYGSTSPDDNARIDALYDALGEEALRSYLARDSSGAVERFGKHSAAWFTSLIAEQKASSVLVVGHGVLLCAIGFALTKNELLLDVVLGRCEGFSVALHGLDVTLPL